MTSDSVEPQTKREAKPETFRSHLPAIAAATAGAVLATVLGSYIGIAGTVVGIALGSMVSGTVSWWLERVIRKSAAKAEGQASAIRARGRQQHPREPGAISRVVDAVRHGRGRRWAGPAAFIVAAFVGCVIVLTLVEHAAGKPLSAVVQGQPGHGTTLGGGGVGKAATPGPSATPKGATHSPAPSGPSSTTPSGASSPTASTTPSGASSPTVSTAPAATTPGTSPGSTGTPRSAAPSAAPTASHPG